MKYNQLSINEKIMYKKFLMWSDCYMGDDIDDFFKCVIEEYKDVEEAFLNWLKPQPQTTNK